ncbi:hypothetical protein HID58_089533 [Brassica napus]|uniref:Uncharacterized protein n=1 Tax=Brassica napus TaxID=3708 RepID=A0ABQ7XZB4_BRANA|nr:hypothetical protein HID58_089533 [Brassica napus]
MLPLKLARSLLLHETLNLTHNSGDTDENARKNPKTPLLFFVPSRELISETYRLASIARDLGMDLYPTPSLSHIIFSFPPRESGSAPSPFSTSSSRPSTCWSSSAASMSSSLSWSLPNDAVMLSFPSLSDSSLSHLRSFVSLSNGLFKLVFSPAAVDTPSSSVSNWDCCSVSLFSRLTSARIGSMESFSQALASNGWTIYKTKANQSTGHSNAGSSAYLFRKVYSGRVMMTREGNGGSCRVRELRLPQLDFENAPLRILQYLMLMTDDLFFLA